MMHTEKTDGLWYVLSLVDVRVPVNGITPAARARAPGLLQALIDRERVPLYEDGDYYKSFRRGGPLEWREDPLVCGMGNVSPVYAVSDIPIGAHIARADVVREIPTVDELAARALGFALLAKADAARAEVEQGARESLAEHLKKEQG